MLFQSQGYLKWSRSIYVDVNFYKNRAVLLEKIIRLRKSIFDPFEMYSSVACHETIGIFLAHGAARDVIVEEGDVALACLYVLIDCKVFIEQPKDSTNRKKRPGFVCRLEKSMYGIRQAGKIWGSLLVKALTNWGLKTFPTYSRVVFLSYEFLYIILCVTLDDLAFSSNATSNLDSFKNRLPETFDVKLFGEIKSFAGW